MLPKFCSTLLGKGNAELRSLKLTARRDQVWGLEQIKFISTVQGTLVASLELFVW